MWTSSGCPDSAVKNIVHIIDPFSAFWNLQVSEMLLPDSVYKEARRKRFNCRVRMTEWVL